MVQLLEQFEPAHSRQIGVDEQACGFARIKGLEKGSQLPKDSTGRPSSSSTARIASRTRSSSLTTMIAAAPEALGAS